MNALGYIVPESLLRLAMEKATPEQAQQLAPCVDTVIKLDELERTFPARLDEARSKAGIDVPERSQAAREAAAQSASADAEIARLLHRRCNRAETAGDIVRELLAVAKPDLQNARFLVEGSPDEPARQILEELYDKKRDVVKRFKSFLKTA